MTFRHQILKKVEMYMAFVLAIRARRNCRRESARTRSLISRLCLILVFISHRSWIQGNRGLPPIVRRLNRSPEKCRAPPITPPAPGTLSHRRTGAFAVSPAPGTAAPSRCPARAQRTRYKFPKSGTTIVRTRPRAAMPAASRSAAGIPESTSIRAGTGPD